MFAGRVENQYLVGAFSSSDETGLSWRLAEGKGRQGCSVAKCDQADAGLYRRSCETDRPAPRHDCLFLTELSYGYMSHPFVRSCRLNAAICASIEVGKMEQYVISPVIPQRAHLGSETQFSRR
jgi:hypothetical protein